ncbi:cytochrome-b5 reductase [Vararia minispora EC-137]|uniref:Cytochrome-b5 reductase n=1 Tax=Vararia minispora EC-137 TaxID=1314806 RepID=A0ACB8QH76_9AGAM|nr:cytochrome-b5 reductase [Vararia minispora EC-137]
MSLLRASFSVSRPAFRASARRFSTAPPKKDSNLPYYLIGASALGFGAYFLLGGPTESKLPRFMRKEQEHSPLDPKEFKDFKLKRVEPYNHNTSRFVFELPKDEASLLPVASCVVIRSSDPAALADADGKPVVRPYTPISPPDRRGELEFLIKKYDTGKASKYVHEQLRPGDTLSIKGPIPKFPYKQNEFEEVALIGGGSGVTPLWQILDHALSDPHNTTRFTLLFANQTERDILLREDLDALQKKHPKNLSVVYVVDQGSESWTGPMGYISKDLIKQHVAPASRGEKVKVFICGPPGQVNAIAGKKAGMKQGPVGGVLKELGYTEEQVYKF